MPRFDGTGPWGEGPMTGGRRGLCVSGRRAGTRMYGGRGYGRRMGLNQGRGYGTGRSRGVGRCWWGSVCYDSPYWSTWSENPHPEIDSLKDQAQALRNELAEIEFRMGELDKKEN